MHGCIVSQVGCGNTLFVNGGFSAWRIVIVRIEFWIVRPRWAGPLDCLSNQGNTVINPPSDLRGKFLETLCPERACCSLRGHRQYRRHGEMKPRMKGNGLIRDPEIAIELFDLTAQSGEMAPNARGIADIVVRTKETLKRCFDQRRFCSTRALRRFCEPRRHGFTEINANSGFHGKSRLSATAIIGGANEPRLHLLFPDRFE